MVTVPYESVEAGPPPVTTEEGMIEGMVQNALDTHDNGWSGVAERNDTLPMSTDQAFYEMWRKNVPVHDGNKENGVHISSPTAKTHNRN